MDKFLWALAILCLIFLVIGLIRPELMTTRRGTPGRKKIAWVGIALCLMFGLSAASVYQLTHPMTAAQLAEFNAGDTVKMARRLQPDMIVTFPRSGVACQTEDLLRRAVPHYYREHWDQLGDLTQIDSSGQPACTRIKDDVRWRILSIQPSLDEMEIGLADEKLPRGWWAEPSAAEIVSLHGG
jgi:hypothetical protein